MNVCVCPAQTTYGERESEVNVDEKRTEVYERTYEWCTNVRQSILPFSMRFKRLRWFLCVQCSCSHIQFTSIATIRFVLLLVLFMLGMWLYRIGIVQSTVDTPTGRGASEFLKFILWNLFFCIESRQILRKWQCWWSEQCIQSEFWNFTNLLVATPK